MTKKCSKCNKIKGLHEFHKDSSKRDGLRTTCISCKKDSDKNYYKNNVESFHNKRVVYYEKTKEKAIRDVREWRLKKVYNISPDDYYTMLENQNFKCKICLSANNGNKKHRYFCIDHDHKTGKVRGLLCSNCNKGLGHFKDNIHILDSAIQYLIKL